MIWNERLCVIRTQKLLPWGMLLGSKDEQEWKTLSVQSMLHSVVQNKADWTDTRKTASFTELLVDFWSNVCSLFKSPCTVRQDGIKWWIIF